MQLLDRSAVTFQVVLTKADKLGPGELSGILASVAQGLGRHPAAFPEIVVTTAETGLGIATLRALIAEMA
jgi:GTP-binding protein